MDDGNQSMPSGRAFDFDHLLGNTVVYRRALMAAVMKNPSPSDAVIGNNAEPMGKFDKLPPSTPIEDHEHMDRSILNGMNASNNTTLLIQDPGLHGFVQPPLETLTSPTSLDRTMRVQPLGKSARDTTVSAPHASSSFSLKRLLGKSAMRKTK